jgi:N-acyl-D-aspartate/D-glutamate deacylase
MAFQDGGLQMLQQVLMNPDVMPIEKAVHKLTGQSAEWLGLDTGTVKQGGWADVIVVDPLKLRTGLGPPIEHYDGRLHGAMRMVKRSDGVVRQVFVGGRLAFEKGQFVPEFGRDRFGRLLRSAHHA